MCGKQDPWADCQHHRRLRSWVPEFLEAAEQRPVPRRQPLLRMPTWQSSLFAAFTLNARQPLPCTSTWQFSVRSSRNLRNHSRARIHTTHQHSCCCSCPSSFRQNCFLHQRRHHPFQFVCCIDVHGRLLWGPIFFFTGHRLHVRCGDAGSSSEGSITCSFVQH